MNNRFLNGKIAFISGGYRNLGKTIALELAECGAAIIINDLPGILDDKEKSAFLDCIRAKNVRAFLIDGDISVEASVKKIHDEIRLDRGVVQILVNCAGPFNSSPFLELDDTEWDKVMNANLKAIYLTAKAFCPDMKAAKWGRIVNLSAGSSFVRNHGVYGLAKAGVSFLTEELATELGPEITINAIAPGQIEESVQFMNKIDPSFGDHYKERAPLKKLVRRDDVAKMVSMLCSPISDMITGETIRIDGGAELPRF